MTSGKIGDSGEPCGVPSAVACQIPSAITPASRYLRMSLRTLRSSTLRATRAISTPELNPVKEPVQVDVCDPFQAVGDAPPRSPHRLVGGPAGTEPERRPRETRIENRREHLRDSLLDQPVQAGRHPQQTLAAPRLGDHHPADRRRP